MIYPKYIFLFLLFAFTSQAQQSLSLEQAIAVALENNHQIKIRKYDVEISEKQIHPALVGKKPVLDLNASYELGWSDARVETLNVGPGESEPLNLDGFSHDVIISPEISFLLLDGKASTYRLDELSKVGEITRLQLRQVIEETAMSVTTAYLDMGLQQSLISITQENIELSQNRLERSKVDARFGTSGSLQRLQIEVDLKADSASLRNLQLNYENARRELNYLLGQDPETSFTVDQQLNLEREYRLEDLVASLQQNNTLLKLGTANIDLAEIDVRIKQSAYKPTLQAYANASFVYLQDDANFLQSNRTFGPNVGVKFQYPIFDGGARKIREQTALITQQKRSYERSSSEQELIKELYNAFAIYQNNLEQLRIERSNLVLFVQNLENIRNRYQLGQATNTEVRSAQLNLSAAQNRVENYQFTIKQAEVMLLFLSGQLTGG